MQSKNTFKVLIDGIPHTLTYKGMSHGGFQYNTEGNKEAHTFKSQLSTYPVNSPIITNGHTYVIWPNTYATGATSQLVNELILFTNNDQELVKERDNIYDMYREAAREGWEKRMKFRLLNTLFYKASNKYLDTHTGEEYTNMQLITVQEQNEYLQVYVDNLENWKITNPIKKRP